MVVVRFKIGFTYDSVQKICKILFADEISGKRDDGACKLTEGADNDAHQVKTAAEGNACKKKPGDNCRDNVQYVKEV